MAMCKRRPVYQIARGTVRWTPRLKYPHQCLYVVHRPAVMALGLTDIKVYKYMRNSAREDPTQPHKTTISIRSNISGRTFAFGGSA